MRFDDGDESAPTFVELFILYILGMAPPEVEDTPPQ